MAEDQTALRAKLADDFWRSFYAGIETLYRAQQAGIAPPVDVLEAWAGAAGALAGALQHGPLVERDRSRVPELEALLAQMKD